MVKTVCVIVFLGKVMRERMGESVSQCVCMCV